MTRRRRGRRPEDSREGNEVQPRVGPDGRPDDRRFPPPNAYMPPPSPLTRWQHHRPYGARQRGRGGREADRIQRFGPGARPGGTPRSAPAGAERVRGDGGTRDDQRSAPPPQRARRFGGNDRPRLRPDAPRTPPARERASAPTASSTASTIDPFELFCAYHLGITPDGGYRIQNIHEVARRFGTNAAELRQILADLGMAADDIVHSAFDLPSAQVDIMVAPEGISRRELARPLYDEFRQAPKKARDWAREMEDAQRQINETIGRDGRWSPAPRDPAGKQS